MKTHLWPPRILLTGSDTLPPRAFQNMSKHCWKNSKLPETFTTFQKMLTSFLIPNVPSHFPKHHHTFQTKIETKQCKNKKHNPTESKTVKTSFEFLHNSWKHWKQNITHHYKSLQYSNNNGGFSMFWNHGPTLQKTKMFQEYLSLWRIPKNPQSYS